MIADVSSRREFLAASLALAVSPARAQAAKLPVIASFSILADIVRRVGGERVDVTALVQPGNDAHVYNPTPDDARKLAAAKLIVMNGLGFEGWIERLMKASGAKAPVVVATKGVKPIQGAEKRNDPHAWQNIANVKIYVANIGEALEKADPAGAKTFETNGLAFAAELDALEAEVRKTLDAIPPERRRIITSHDAFGYVGAT